MKLLDVTAPDSNDRAICGYYVRKRVEKFMILRSGEQKAFVYQFSLTALASKVYLLLYFTEIGHFSRLT